VPEYIGQGEDKLRLRGNDESYFFDYGATKIDNYETLITGGVGYSLIVYSVIAKEGVENRKGWVENLIRGVVNLNRWVENPIRGVVNLNRWVENMNRWVENRNRGVENPNRWVENPNRGDFWVYFLVLGLNLGKSGGF
jgi:hypothetical protein